jgi:SAM-dependent methyltransferase
MDPEEYNLMFRVEDFHWWYVGMRRITTGLLRRDVESPRQMRILDAGCGTGGMLTALKEFGLVVGVDVAEEAVNLCQRRHCDFLVRGSITDLPFASGSFDLITSFDVIYHLAVENDLQALREFHRLLAPGGSLLIRVPAYDFLRGRHDVVVHTRQRYTKKLLRQKLENAGFTITRLTYANCLLFVPAALKRFAENVLTPKAKPRSDIYPPSPWLNSLLAGILSLEAGVIQGVPLPFGLSVIGLARKREGLC